MGARGVAAAYDTAGAGGGLASVPATTEGVAATTAARMVAARPLAAAAGAVATAAPAAVAGEATAVAAKEGATAGAAAAIADEEVAAAAGRALDRRTIRGLSSSLSSSSSSPMGMTSQVAATRLVSSFEGGS
ncbi:antifreeze protein Maxi-like [Brachypodium distachyon]|uniref:antifreeze protein Maxi-like n=1 Tax=Brachypodium distachyon TaxID=15368 RepID=UPI00052FDC2D|nr:antifreeze protein Maxi-like [Brachypodium distachyon]|eukprot:XP_010233403.1 antifreeze protein Maxi-like [Brachypodium distachyon]